MSLGSRGEGGIGLPWLKKYWADIYQTQHDAMIVDGRKRTIPKYFIDKMDSILGAESQLMADFDSRRQLLAEKNADNATPERLRIREQCAAARIAFFEGR